MAKPVLVRVSAENLSEFSTEDLYRELIGRYGEDPTRDGLLRTPERVRKSMEFLTRGYKQDAGAILRGAMFDVDYDEMVIVKDVEVFSMCEHHICHFLEECMWPTFRTGR